MAERRDEWAFPRPITWLQSDRPLARYVARPVQSFLEVEAAGGILLVIATVVALVWANSPWKAGYFELFHTHVVVDVGSVHFDESLVHVIDDALMALFFFVVGLEIKREWVAGELRDRHAALLPGIAAIGGMVVPALIYAAINAGSPALRGWAIPMATDIAFALAVAAMLGPRVPSQLKVFLLTLAIVDDIGAIIVIAVFYTDDLQPAWLLVAAGIVGLVVLGKRAGVRSPIPYVLLGLGLWVAVFASGIHATIAGVIMGLLTPAVALIPDVEAQALVDELELRPGISADDVRRAGFLLKESVPLTERLEHLLHPWTSYVIVPLFALANAGIPLGGGVATRHEAVVLGVVLGLVVGKVVGITGSSWLALRLRIGSLPEGVRFSQVAAVSVLAGIGFTVSLFITGLAFGSGPTSDAAKAGILLASVLAAVGGSVALVLADRDRSVEQAPAEVAAE